MACERSAAHWQPQQQQQQQTRIRHQHQHQQHEQQCQSLGSVKNCCCCRSCRKRPGTCERRLLQRKRAPLSRAHSSWPPPLLPQQERSPRQSSLLLLLQPARWKPSWFRVTSRRKQLAVAGDDADALLQLAAGLPVYGVQHPEPRQRVDGAQQQLAEQVAPQEPWQASQNVRLSPRQLLPQLLQQRRYPP